MTGRHTVSGPSVRGQASSRSLQRCGEDPDADVLKALAQGDAQALNVLMQRHLGAIKSVAWHMLGDEMRAEDIAQEVFLRAWKQAPNWQSGQAKFSTWMHRVAKNLCYDVLRKKTETLSDTIPEMADVAPVAPQVILAQEAEENRHGKLAAALEKLPERQRMAITLCHYQDMSQVEAAAIMDVGVRAYESLLARARRNLRGFLATHKEELLNDMGDIS